MDRAGKAEAIKSLEGVIADSGSVIVARYTGLSVAEMTEFRGKLREQGASAKVVKNRLFKKALDGKGGDAASSMFVDQTVIAFADDPVAAATRQALQRFPKCHLARNKLQLSLPVFWGRQVNWVSASTRLARDSLARSTPSASRQRHKVNSTTKTSKHTSTRNRKSENG